MHTGRDFSAGGIAVFTYDGYFLNAQVFGLLYALFLCRSPFFPVLGWSPSLLLFKQPGKIQGVIVPYGSGDIADRQVCFPQKTAGPADPVVQKIFLGRSSGNVFKEPVKIGAFNIQIIGDHMDIYFMGVIIFNIPEGFFHIGDLLFLGRNIGPGKLAGQEI